MSSERAAQLVEAGVWLKLSGDLEGAKKLFERALKLDPGNTQAQAELEGRGEEPSAPEEPGVSAPPVADLDGDWGRMAGGSASPVPQIAPVEPVSSSRSSGTMQLFPDAPTKSGTMVMHPERAEPVKRPTQQLPQKTGTLELHPERPAPSRKRTTQLFSEAAVKPMKGRTTQLFQGVDEVPAPRTTAPLFPVEEPDAARPPPPVPDAPVIDAAVPLPADTGEAWGWSAADYAAPMEPRPSPALSPSAESAWDQRTNPGIKLEVQGDDRPLDLLTSDSKITRAPPDAREELNVILRGARDLLDLDDHTGAMELVNKARELAPDDPEVVAIAERSEKTLLTMYESKLGRLESVPRVLLKDDEIIWLNLDHRAGFVLAQIDGTVCFDDLFSVSGMSRIDTARIIAQLIDEGVISRE